MTSASNVEIFGIRHHGPGSARCVRRALEALRPTAVVIEGPPEMDALIALAADRDLRPPIAGLVYDVKEPKNASFYPMAVFSPEWVALQWAVANNAKVQFADLPAANRLALRTKLPESKPDNEKVATPPVEQVEPNQQVGPEEAAGVADKAARNELDDPIGMLARLAGYDDPEQWWEDAIEQRSPSGEAIDQFRSVREAMTELRLGDSQQVVARYFLAEREAAMRRILRKVVKDNDGPVAVVCGAFHSPVLHPDNWPSAASDNATLKGLPKTKVAATWAPWTSARLSYRSGYGAGVDAPRWYEHLFTTTDDVIARWMVRVARMLRSNGHDASPASAVEATRLAETLASLRGRPLPGLAEVSDASIAVLGNGSTATLRAIADQLLVGSELGTVPDSTPLVPLAEDLTKHQRSLRLKRSAEQKIVIVDLRKEAQLERSVFFRRLNLLDISWATQTATGRTGGTFKEAWQLEWVPELAISVIEASLYGTTLLTAASAKVRARASESDSLQGLAELVEACLLADLPEALVDVLDAIAVRSAAVPDQIGLMSSIEPLARTQRYGDVRKINTALIRGVLSTMVRRAAIGLATACVSLNDEAAGEMRAAIESVDRGITLIEDDQLLAVWQDALLSLAPLSIHGSVAGSVSRILLDAARIDRDEASRRLQRALSLVNPPADTAAWLDGFLAGDVAFLLYDPQLFGLIDTWLVSLEESDFEELLPLIRRTFSRFQKPERRQIGELVSRGSGLLPDASSEEGVNQVRAAPAAAKVAELLGLQISNGRSAPTNVAIQ